MFGLESLPKHFYQYSWPSMTRKIPWKMNLHTCQVIVVCGVLTAILHYASVVLSPFQDKTVGSTPQPLQKPCRVSPHFVGRHAVVVKDRFQATSLNKYLVISVAWRLNVIRRTNTTASSRSKEHTCYPVSQCLRGCWFKRTLGMIAVKSVHKVM